MKEWSFSPVNKTFVTVTSFCMVSSSVLVWWNINAIWRAIYLFCFTLNVRQAPFNYVWVHVFCGLCGHLVVWLHGLNKVEKFAVFLPYFFYSFNSFYVDILGPRRVHSHFKVNSVNEIHADRWKLEFFVRASRLHLQQSRKEKLLPWLSHI